MAIRWADDRRAAAVMVAAIALATIVLCHSPLVFAGRWHWLMAPLILAAVALTGMLAASRNRSAPAVPVNGDISDTTQFLFLKSPVPIGIFDQESLRFLAVNEAMATQYGYVEADFLRMRVPDLWPADAADNAEKLQALQCCEGGVVRQRQHVTRDGLPLHVEISAHPLRYLGRNAWMMISRDIGNEKLLESRVEELSRLLEQQVAERTAALENEVRLRRQLEQQALEQANHDALTRLPNRTLLRDRLRQAMARANRNKQLLAVFYLDLDRFKAINDTFGHEAGDQVLKEVAARLKASVRDTDTVARLSGDEFSVLLEDVGSLENTIEMAERVLGTLSAPMQFNQVEIFCGASMGITTYPCPSVETVNSILAKADSALYFAKSQGRNNYQLYAGHMDDRSFRRYNLETQIRRALERNEMYLQYQPQVEIASGRIMGAEALLRWENSELGRVSPQEFIPVAEETGLIVPIGEWVLKSACAQKRLWNESGCRVDRIAVNVSARQFKDPRFVGMVRDAVLAANLGPDELELEITERALMDDTAASTRILEELRGMGVLFSVDDFGTGYSSLNYLKHFPLDMLKIDASFVQDIGVDPKDAAIIKAIISMSQSLELTVMAEGVETAAQLEFLRQHKCDGMQGYFFSRPLSGAHFADLLSSYRHESVVCA